MTQILTDDETASLRLIAGMMIPPSAKHGVPGADDDTIFADITRLKSAELQKRRAERLLTAYHAVAAVIRATPWAFDAVRYAGAAYLVWIGIQAIRHRAAFSMAGEGGLKALGAIYRQSVIGNVLNPKVTLFFLAFLPQFVDVPAGHVGWQMALLGAVFMANTVVIFGAVALFAGAIGDWMRRKPAVGERLNLFAGLTFIGLGIRVAMADLARP